MTGIGKYIKKLRGKRSLRELERLSGVSHTYLSSVEKGKDPRSGKELIPTPDVLSKLAKPLEVDYVKLMIIAGYINKEDDWNKAFVQEGFHVDPDVVYKRVLENQKTPRQDLMELLENKNDLTYNGVDLMDQERKQILDMLAVLFPGYTEIKK